MRSWALSGASDSIPGRRLHNSPHGPFAHGLELLHGLSRRAHRACMHDTILVLQLAVPSTQEPGAADMLCCQARQTVHPLAAADLCALSRVR